MKKLGWIILLACSAAAISAGAPYQGGAIGNETVNYTYDELGRLTGSNTTGGPNNTRATGTCFDKTGNRMRYDVATSAPSACPTPAP